MKCGHPDTMDNLLWNRMENGHHGMSLGGTWRCKTCSYAQHNIYRNTLKGLVACERAHRVLNAQRRGGR